MGVREIVEETPSSVCTKEEFTMLVDLPSEEEDIDMVVKYDPENDYRDEDGYKDVDT